MAGWRDLCAVERWEKGVAVSRAAKRAVSRESALAAVRKAEKRASNWVCARAGMKAERWVVGRAV